MSLKFTKSKITSNPASNNPIIVGEGDVAIVKLLPIEQFEIKSPNFVPVANFVPLKPQVIIKPTFDDVPIQKAIQTSKNLRTSRNIPLENQRVSTDRAKAEFESSIRLTSGNAKTVRAVERRSIEPNNPVFKNDPNARTFAKTNLLNGFYEQNEQIIDVQSTELVPEVKVLAMMDLSELSAESMEELLIARRLESNIDDKLLKSLFALIERNQSNADYIYGLESEIREEIKNAESILNTVSSFDDLMDATKKSLNIGENRLSLYENFQNNSNFYEFKIASNEDLLASFGNDFIKAFENLNAMDDASKVDPQFLIWKNLESLSEMLRNGVSNRYLLEQSKRGFDLEYLNFDYDGSFSKFKNFEIMSLDGFEPMDRIFYYINCICNELNQSIGLGTLQSATSNFDDGDDWLSKNFGLKEDWLNYDNDQGFYQNLFINDPSNVEKPLMRLGFDGAFYSYLNQFKRNAKINTFQNYDASLLKTQQEFELLENNVLKLSNLQEKNKKLLNPRSLFQRIFESFNDLINDLNQNDSKKNDDSNKEKMLSLALLSLTSSNVTGQRLEMKHKLFLSITKTLKNISEERQSNDIKLSLPDIRNFVFPQFKSNLQISISNEIRNPAFSFNDDNLKNLIEKIQSKNLNENIVFHKIIQVFLELEKECIDLNNKKRFKIEFLTEDGKTKFSNLDSSKFLFMIYEIFAILTQVFLKISFGKKISKIGTGSATITTFQIDWEIVSDEIKEALKKIPKSFEKDDFQPFFDSFKTITANDNIGFLNNVYGGVVTAQSFYELNESFKKEQSTLIYHLSSIKTVLNNFQQSTARFSEYAKILRNDSSIQESKLTAEQKSLKSFLNTDIGLSFFDDISKLRISRARLRLMKLKSLSKPFDLASIDPTVYDALRLYVKTNDYFGKNNLMILTSIDQSILKEIVDLDYNNKLKMSLKVTKVNELQDARYQPRIISTLPLGYCLTKDLLNETVLESESKGLNILSSLNELVDGMKIFDMSNSSIINETEPLANSNIDNESKKALIDSYLAATLVEIIARVDLDMPGTFKNNVGYNAEVTRKLIDMAGSVLGVESAFESLFKIVNNEPTLRDKEDVQRNFRSETNIISEKGTTVQLDDGFDYAKIDMLHTMLDTIYFRKGRLKEMIFSDNDTAQVFGIVIDPEDFVYENDFNPDDDNEVRFDSLYLKTEFF
jgi:hypothetical protein